MLDPVITPLAAFGLATSILNYLISTAQNLHGKYHEIKDFPEVFSRYAHTVYDCLQSYDLWLRLWHRPNEASYQDLFGPDGWIAIKACRQDVERLIIQTADILCLRVPVTPPRAEGSVASTGVSTLRRAASSLKSALKSPARLVRHSRTTHTLRDLREVPIKLEAGDPLKWQKFTGALEGFLTTYQPEELVLKRIVGVLGPNQNLRNKIADLEKAIASLAKRTSNVFQLMGHGQEPKGPDEVEMADNIIKFRVVARDLIDVIRTQVKSNGERGTWFLELDFPNGAGDGNIAVAQIIRNCSISFVARTLLPDRSTMQEFKLQRLRGFLETEATDVSTLAVAIAEFHTKCTWTVSMPSQPGPPVYQLDCSYPSPKLLMQDWRRVLDACSKNQETRKALELERARFALGLTLWFILLWETEWFDHVCSCAFRCVLFSPHRDGEIHDSTASDDDHDGAACRQEHVYATLLPHTNPARNTPTIPEGEIHREPPALPSASCRGQTDMKHRLYHFGMLLAELALARLIHLSSDLDQNPRTNSFGQPVGQFRRIREIRNHKDIPAQLKEAIEFCFDKGREEKWSAETNGLAASRMRDFLDGVVKPVNQYHDVVKQNFNYARQFTALAQDFEDDDYEQFEDAQG